MKTDIPWYRRTQVGIEVGPTGAQFGPEPDTRFAEHFSGQQIVEWCVKANAEYLVIWAMDGEFAYYDSKLALKAPGLGRRDVLRESVETASQHDLPVIAYCQLQYAANLLRQSPKYHMQDCDGNLIPGRVCFNSGYLDYAQQIASEMMAYGIDGFHFDMMDQGFGPPYGCWCPNCQAQFEAKYNRPMPTEIRWDAAWKNMLEFRYASSARFEEVLTAFVRSQQPNISVDFNYHGGPPFSWETGQRPVQHAHVGDFVTGECGLWAFGALHTSLAALFTAATKPGAVYQIVMQRNACTYHDMTTRPLADLRWEALTLLSHGAQVTVVDKTPYDGRLDPVAYERMGAVFAEAHRKREHFGQKPWQEVGLYYSSQSRDWYGQDAPDRYQRAFLGAHRALIYAHMPTGILLDENISLEKLQRFSVVYLPNVAVLTKQEAELLTHYVHEGGNLLITGMTGLYDSLGRKRDECILRELVGGRFVQILPSLDNHVSLDSDGCDLVGISQDIPPDWPFLVYGQAAVFEPIDAQPYGTLYRPHQTLNQRTGEGNYPLPMSADVPVGPAMLIHEAGRGKVVHLPCSPDVATASEYRTAEPRLLIRNLVRYLNPEPEVEVSAPLHVESIITDDAASRTLRIHLIGYLSPPACTGPGRPHSNHVLPSLMEEAPLYRARMTLRRPFSDIDTLCAGTEVTVHGNHIDLTVNEVHETLIVRYRAE